MIAMAKSFEAAKELMTVRQVMDEIGAKATTTVWRMIKNGKLRAERIGAMGWLVHRDSVRALMASEAAKPAGVGFPRGRSRAATAQKQTRARRKKSRR